MDVLVEDFGDEVVLGLRGTFDLRQLPAVREKLEMLAEGPGKVWFFQLEHARFRDPAYLDLFLDICNRLKGRDNRMILLFRNEENQQFFHRLRHIFEIHFSRSHYHRSGLLNRLRQTGVTYSKRTGMRLSPGVAIVLLVLLAGWILTLFSVIRNQEQEIRARETRLLELESRKRISEREIYELRSAIGPLRDLGIVVDSSGDQTLGSLTDWVEYLERMEARRRGH
jgi:anti-anti-sigma regulatory factor